MMPFELGIDSTIIFSTSSIFKGYATTYLRHDEVYNHLTVEVFFSYPLQIMGKIICKKKKNGFIENLIL